MRQVLIAIIAVFALTAVAQTEDPAQAQDIVKDQVQAKFAGEVPADVAAELQNCLEQADAIKEQLKTMSTEDAEAKMEQLKTEAKDKIQEKLGELPEKTQEQVKKALADVEAKMEQKKLKIAEAIKAAEEKKGGE